MAVPKYNDSPYKYTDPIRLFKANDPYYWEVDNIPLKQLEENVKWLKDQLKQEETDPDNISVNLDDLLLGLTMHLVRLDSKHLLKF